MNLKINYLKILILLLLIMKPFHFDETPDETPPEVEEAGNEDDEQEQENAESNSQENENPEGDPEENPEGNPEENPEGDLEENPEGDLEEEPTNLSKINLACNQEFLMNFGLTGTEKPIEEPLEMCPSVKHSCCTKNDQLKIFERWGMEGELNDLILR